MQRIAKAAALALAVVWALAFAPTSLVSVQANEPLIPVTDFRFSGQTAFSSETLLQVVDDLTGRELTFAELEEGAERITRFYREHGYMLAHAYVPEQTIADDGVVEIAVLEGRYGEVILHNGSRLSDSAARRILHPVAPGALIRSKSLERALLLLFETPGVASRSSFAAGREAGASDLTVELHDTEQFSGALRVDNDGNELTGRVRLSILAEVNNPLGTGDRIDLQTITAGGSLMNGRLGYSAPLGIASLRWNVAYTSSRYQMGGALAALGVDGDTQIWRLGLTYPHIRTAPRPSVGSIYLQRLDWGAAYELRELENRVAGFDGARQARAMLLSVAGGGHLLGAPAQVGVVLTGGALTIPDPMEKLLDDLGAKTSGEYIKIHADLSHWRSVGRGLTLRTTIMGQWTSKNLHNSEKLPLGGTNGVRAYGAGEASGDLGAILRLELQGAAFRPDLQWTGFFDGGVVQVNKEPWEAGANRLSRFGIGTGLIYRPSETFDARVDFAVPVWDSESTEGRLGVQIGVRW